MNTRIRLNVTFGSRLLHHISPFQFVDSPEWYATQNAFPHDLKASKPQVLYWIFFPSPSLRFQLFTLCWLHLRRTLSTKQNFNESVVIVLDLDYF